MQHLRRLGVRGALLAALALVWTLCVAGALGLLDGIAPDFLFQDVLYCVLLVAASTACLVRGAKAKAERLPWTLMGIGLVCWTVADGYWILVENAAGEVPSPSIGDIFYLAFYPAAYAALVVLVRQRSMVRRLDLWLDGAIGASCAAAVTVALVLPAFHISAADAAEMGINIAYPVLDVVLLVFVIMVVALSGWRPGRSWALLGAAVAVMAVADSAYLVEATSGTYQTGQLIDAGWAASTLLIALAAWQPSNAISVPFDTDRRLVLIPFSCGMIALLVVALGLFGGLAPTAAGLALGTLLLVTLRMALAFRDAQRTMLENHNQAMTDGLTGLGNRRRLIADLQRFTRSVSPESPFLCVLLDLDGFKAYNDTFGHPAGDDLLARLGQRLGEVAGRDGCAYRLGGDEFCLVARNGADATEEVVAAARAALSEVGEAFTITSSAGAVLVPHDVSDPTEVLQLADRRMYAEKGTRSTSTECQSHAVLVRLLRERAPELHAQHNDLAQIALAVGHRLGMEGEHLDELARAAELHDVGKIAIPDAILDRPGRLDSEELSYMQRHPVIGERILGAAPALRPVARLVRSTHERYDGDGYPDGLAGEDIPLGARVVAACDAYIAMVSDGATGPALSSSAAIAALRSRSGAQLDPSVVEALAASMAELAVDEPVVQIRSV